MVATSARIGFVIEPYRRATAETQSIADRYGTEPAQHQHARRRRYARAHAVLREPVDIRSHRGPAATILFVNSEEFLTA